MNKKKKKRPVSFDILQQDNNLQHNANQSGKKTCFFFSMTVSVSRLDLKADTHLSESEPRCRKNRQRLPKQAGRVRDISEKICRKATENLQKKLFI